MVVRAAALAIVGCAGVSSMPRRLRAFLMRSKRATRCAVWRRLLDVCGKPFDRDVRSYWREASGGGRENSCSRHRWLCWREQHAASPASAYRGPCGSRGDLTPFHSGRMNAMRPCVSCCFRIGASTRGALPCECRVRTRALWVCPSVMTCGHTEGQRWWSESRRSCSPHRCGRLAASHMRHACHVRSGQTFQVRQKAASERLLPRERRPCQVRSIQALECPACA